MTLKPRTKKSRGEWYLPVQAALFVLVVFGPRSLPGVPEAPCSPFVVGTGVILFSMGIVLAAAGVSTLGSNLTPFPRPKDDATLVVTGAYRLVRHPIYSGITFMALGWAAWRHSWATAGYALLLLVFFDVKSRREEHWLEEKFPEYGAYRRRVRKLIPFVY